MSYHRKLSIEKGHDQDWAGIIGDTMTNERTNEFWLEEFCNR